MSTLTKKELLSSLSSEEISKDTKYYYKVTFFYSSNATTENSSDLNEISIPWYINSDKKLSVKEIFEKCIQDIKNSGRYQDLIECADFKTSVQELSRDEFLNSFGIMM